MSVYRSKTVSLSSHVLSILRTLSDDTSGEDHPPLDFEQMSTTEIRIRLFPPDPHGVECPGFIEMWLRQGTVRSLEITKYFIMSRCKRARNWSRRRIFRWIDRLARELGCHIVYVGEDEHIYKFVQTLPQRQQILLPSRSLDILANQRYRGSFYQREWPGSTIVTDNDIDEALTGSMTYQRFQEIRRRNSRVKTRVRTLATYLTVSEIFGSLLPPEWEKDAGTPLHLWVHRLWSAKDYKTLKRILRLMERRQDCEKAKNCPSSHIRDFWEAFRQYTRETPSVLYRIDSNDR